MVDIPSLEQRITVQQGLTTRRSMYPRLNKESHISSIGTHGSMADVPSLEPGAIHNNIFIHFRDQQGTSSRDGIIILLFYSVYKTIQNSNKIFNTHHINSNNMFIVQPICSLTHTYTQTSRSSYLELSTHCFPFPYEFLLNTSLTSSPIIVS